MSEDDSYKNTFPGIYALGSMVKANRTNKPSVSVIKPKRKGKSKKKRISATKYAEKLIYG
jgi:hypothetical protein